MNDDLLDLGLPPIPARPTTIDVADIVGVGELAAHFRRSRGAITNWRDRYPDFPAPIRELVSGSLYSMTQVVAWHASRTWPPVRQNGE